MNSEFWTLVREVRVATSGSDVVSLYRAACIGVEHTQGVQDIDHVGRVGGRLIIPWVPVGINVRIFCRMFFRRAPERYPHLYSALDLPHTTRLNLARDGLARVGYYLTQRMILIQSCQRCVQPLH
jgi:hypothetical protein